MDSALQLVSEAGPLPEHVIELKAKQAGTDCCMADPSLCRFESAAEQMPAGLTQHLSADEYEGVLRKVNARIDQHEAEWKRRVPVKILLAATMIGCCCVRTFDLLSIRRLHRDVSRLLQAWGMKGLQVQLFVGVCREDLALPSVIRVAPHGVAIGATGA